MAWRGPLDVAMRDVDAEDPFEVAALRIQRPVQTLGAHTTKRRLG
jgi:hypothetical protein